MGVQPCLLLLVFLHSRPDCRNFLSEHCNIMSRQHLCGEGFPPSLSLLQVDVFQENQGILQQIILFPSNKPKKACIAQSLTRKYHHTVIESLYLLCGAKISQAPTSAGVSCQFGFVLFPICLQCKISGSSVFLFFFL